MSEIRLHHRTTRTFTMDIWPFIWRDLIKRVDRYMTMSNALGQLSMEIHCDDQIGHWMRKYMVENTKWWWMELVRGIFGRIVIAFECPRRTIGTGNSSVEIFVRVKKTNWYLDLWEVLTDIYWGSTEWRWTYEVVMIVATAGLWIKIVVIRIELCCRKKLPIP